MLKKSSFWLFSLVLVLAPALWAQTGFHIIHPFNGGPDDGSTPKESLVYKSPFVYGLTSLGGLYNKGVLFKVKVDGTGFQILHHFGNGTDGQDVTGSLAVSGSYLYGMTMTGGEHGKGTIFKININGSGYTILHSFAGGANDGQSPNTGAPIVVGTSLYGVTEIGGSGSPAGLGTIWKIGINGSGFQVLHSFTGGSDGSEPRGALVYTGTKLYGTTLNGGASGLGTIFRISPSGAGYGIIHSFAGGPGDGCYPSWGTKLAASNGILYGMTSGGGVYGSGVIYRIGTSGAGFRLIHSFGGGDSDGSVPYNSVIVLGTKLYGLAAGGGMFNRGVLFVVGTSGLNFQVLHSFAGGDTNEGAAYGWLTKVVSTSLGTRLYGMTSGDGTTYDTGSVFYHRVK